MIIATFLLWTGELLLAGITLGWHRPKWKGYEGISPFKQVFFEICVMALGFAFWMVSIPTVLKIVESS
jgi:hypothetical protein